MGHRLEEGLWQYGVCDPQFRGGSFGPPRCPVCHLRSHAQKLHLSWGTAQGPGAGSFKCSAEVQRAYFEVGKQHYTTIHVQFQQPLPYTHCTCTKKRFPRLCTLRTQWLLSGRKQQRSSRGSRSYSPGRLPFPAPLLRYYFQKLALLFLVGF